MATNRDVELGISVTTAGSEGIKKLKDEVDALAKGGAAAAPEFQKLSNEIGQLADKAKALEVFDTISKDIDALSLAQQSAAAQTDKLQVELAKASEAADKYREAQQQARTELTQAQTALSEARIALADYKNANKDAIGGTDQYKAAVQQLSAKIIELRSDIVQKAQALRDAKAAAVDAVAEETKLEASYTRSAKEVRQLSTSLREKSQEEQQALTSLRNLGVETDDLVQSEIGLVNAIVDAKQEIGNLVAVHERAARAAIEQAQAAERLAQDEKIAAESYANFWQQALYEREQAEQKTAAAQKASADEAKRAGEAIKNALGTVGIKTVNDLRLEIDQVKTSLKLLADSGTLTGKELDAAMAVGERRIKDLEVQIRAATGQLTLMDRAQKALGTTVGQIGAFITLQEVVQRTATAFIDANKQIESLRLALGTIYGSADTAAKQIDLLRRVADTSGVSIGAISESFVKFSASAKSANIPLEQSNALFAAASRAAGTLGLSGNDLTRILDALSQMASKGVVSMEELRQQLGDSLPGATALAAKGLGLTQSEMIKLVESGGLLASDLFPALTTSLQSLGGEVNTFSAAWERLKNITTTTFQALGDTGLLDALKGAMVGLKLAVSGLGFAFTALLEVLGGFLRSVGGVVAALSAGDGLAGAFNAIQREIDGSVDRLDKYARQLNITGQYTDSIVTKLDNFTKGTAEQEAATGKAIEKIKEQTTASVNQGVATQAAAEKAALAGTTWSKLFVLYGDLKEKADSQVLATEKLAKAKEQEAKNSEELAKLTGNEVLIRETAVTAANTEAKALEEVARVREKTLAQQIALRDAMLDEIKRLGDADGARIKSVEAINQRIDVLTSESERATKAADAARNHALAMEIESANLKDNSKNVEELTGLRKQQADILELLIGLEKTGMATSEQVRAARENLIRTEAQLNDGYKDRIELLKITAASQKADLDLSVSTLNIRKQQLNSLEALARANGDENLAIYAKVEAKKVDIEITNLKVQTMKIEAQASIDIAKATMAELQAKGQLTEAKRIELETAIKIGQIKGKEADALKETTNLMQREIDLIRAGNSSRNQESGSRQRNADAIDSESNALDRKLTLLEKEQALQARADAQKWGRGTDGKIVNAGGDLTTRTGIFNFLKSAGVDDENAARRIANEFADGNGNIPYMNNPGQRRYGGDTISMALLTAAERYTFSKPAKSSASDTKSSSSRANMRSDENPKETTPRDSELQALKARERSSETSTLTGPSTSMPKSTSSTPVSTSSSRTVNINLNGSTTSLNVASDADASALESLLKRLAAQKGSSI